MKKIKGVACLFIIIFIFPFTGFGQVVEEGSITVNKVEKPGYIATSQYSRSLVEDVIQQKLSTAGIGKVKKKKKFYSFKGITVPEISPFKIDLTYAVQKKGRKKSMVFFIVSKGYDNYVTSGIDGVTSANIITFLKQIDENVKRNEDIRRKEKEIKETNENLEREKKKLLKAQEEKNNKTKELNQLKNGGK